MDPVIGGALVSAGTMLGGQLLGGLFAPSVKKQIKWQKQAQMELNQQAADLNYQYGEKAAENAYTRQMQMYERSYQDQSYSAMRKQMEDAGLSVGLMYGNGSSGGGAGSMSGAPQGETGGAVAGDAGAALSAAIAMENAKTQRIAAAADAALKYAEVKRIEKENERTSQLIDMDAFQTAVNQNKEMLASKFAQLDYNHEEMRWMNEFLDHAYSRFLKTGEDEIFSDSYGMLKFASGKEWSEHVQQLSKMVADVGETEARTDFIAFSKVLESKKASALMLQAVAAMERNDIERARVAIEKLATEYGVGEKWNWKTVTDVVNGLASSAARVGGAAAMVKGAKLRR